MQSNWWDTSKMPEFGQHYTLGTNSWIEIPLIQAALKGGLPCLADNASGLLTVSVGDFIDQFSKLLGMKPIRISNAGSGHDQVLLSSDSMMAYLGFGRHGQYVNVSTSTSVRDLANKARKFLEKHLTQEDANLGIVYALAKTPTGFSVQRIGTAGEPLIRENYDPEVLKGYDKIVEDLKSESPSGRLSILSGPPGTGKTFIVRALMKEVPTAVFVMVPPFLVPTLAAPEILPSLAALREDVEGPILFVLEDGDSCLVARDKNNMPSIQAILNLGDGILGSVLDVRILATTNADKLDLDPALRRPGRLSAEVRVGSINTKQAGEILDRLLGRRLSAEDVSRALSANQTPEGLVTLASVYLAARELGWKPKAKKKS